MQVCTYQNKVLSLHHRNKQKINIMNFSNKTIGFSIAAILTTGLIVTSILTSSFLPIGMAVILAALIAIVSTN